MVANRIGFSFKLSPKALQLLNKHSSSSIMLSAINKGFCNSRKLLFNAVDKNTNKEFPSDPDTSWARRTGRANKGLTFAVNGKCAYFGNTVPYVKYLEEGTKKMAKRPAMWIALDENKTNIQKNIENSINEAYGVKK